MNSRQRLLTTLRRQPTDRVPISTYEMVSWNWDAWENHQPAYQNMMQFFRDTTDCMYMVGFPAENRAARYTDTEWDEGNKHIRRRVLHTPRGDLTTTEYTLPGLNTVWRTEHLLKSDEDVARYLSLPRDMALPDLSPYATVLERLGEHGIPLIEVGDPLCTVAELFEFGEFMLRAFTQTDQIIALLDHVAPSMYAHLDYLLDHGIGPLYRICGAEYATPPYMAPSYFERFVVKYSGPMVERVRAHHMFARIHCHGRLSKVLPMIVDMGADATDPLEAPPTGDIEFAEVKRLYGDRLTLLGNVQLRDLETLPADEMRDLIRRTVETGKPGGGFVLMATASPINADLSPITERNYHIMVETALEYGAY